MTETTLPENRWQTIRDIWKDNHWLYALGGVFIGLLLYPAFNFVVEDLATLLQNFVPEAVGIGFTVLFIDQLNQRREEQRRIKDLQEQLVREAGSPIHSVAVNAIDTIRKRGWLGRKNMYDGTPDDTAKLLQRRDFSKANLSGVNLRRADLSHSDLWGANLRDVNLGRAVLENVNLGKANLENSDLQRAILNGANLWDANLSGSNLTSASLKYVDLPETNLQGANLENANLIGTNFGNANLSRANLRNANLQDVKLSDPIWGVANLSDALVTASTKLTKGTILPDGSYWTMDRDLAEFGAETREILHEDYEPDDTGNITGRSIFTFADGITRRWQLGKGWLDDRDGNPI